MLHCLRNVPFDDDVTGEELEQPDEHDENNADEEEEEPLWHAGWKCPRCKSKGKLTVCRPQSKVSSSQRNSQLVVSFTMSLWSLLPFSRPCLQRTTFNFQIVTVPSFEKVVLEYVYLMPWFLCVY